MTPPPRSRTVLAVLAGLLAATVLVSAEPAAASSAPTCHRPARGFVPAKAGIPALGHAFRVIRVPRTRDNAVGAGPVTEQGKWLVAMDPHTLPASRRGTVILAAHTWPDGSALGNALLRGLHRGDRIVLAGKGGKRACYRITERASYPVRDVPRRKAFRSWGREQVVIVACSGRRLGPGNWSRRTIWYGVPIRPAAPAPPPSAPSPPPDDAGSGLGGLLGGLLGGG